MSLPANNIRRFLHLLIICLPLTNATEPTPEVPASAVAATPVPETFQHWILLSNGSIFRGNVVRIDAAFMTVEVPYATDIIKIPRKNLIQLSFGSRFPAGETPEKDLIETLHLDRVSGTFKTLEAAGLILILDGHKIHIPSNRIRRLRLSQAVTPPQTGVWIDLGPLGFIHCLKQQNTLHPSFTQTPTTIHQRFLTHTRPGPEKRDNGLRLPFCWCPAGAFYIGSPKEEAGRNANEQQAHTKLSGFWISKTEITVKDFIAIMGNEKERIPEGTDPALPVTQIEWFHCRDFCKKLTEQERNAGRLAQDQAYRLPTEAEWEYACRAGSSAATTFGARLSGKQANFNSAFPYNGAAKHPPLKQLTKGGAYPENEWGLLDMHGNVAEWCLDTYAPQYSGGDNPVSVGAGPRVVRGGSYRSSGDNCRSADRSRLPPQTRLPTLGFRIVCAKVREK